MTHKQICIQTSVKFAFLVFFLIFGMRVCGIGNIHVVRKELQNLDRVLETPNAMQEKKMKQG